jgi:predicted alpha/beta superfamily hydrolase
VTRPPRFALSAAALASLAALVGCGSEPARGAAPQVSEPTPGDGGVTLAPGGGTTGAPPDAGTIADAAGAAADSGAGGGSDAGDAGGLTTIRVHYPTGTHSLALRGAEAPLSWTTNTPATKTADGWTWSSRNVTAAFDFKPLLDGTTWSLGPNYRVAPGETIDITPRFQSTSAKGSFAVRWQAFASPTLGRTRKVWVYLPPGYAENTEARYPVVYMHDGQNLFDRNAAFGCWYADQALDDGAANGSIREAIIIGPEATSARMIDYTPSVDPGRGEGGGADAYLASLAAELKPLVDRELRTRTGREDTAILGSSLGGLVSAWAGVRRAETFGLVGAMSPSTWWDSTMILGAVSSMGTQATKPLRVYVDSGNAGPSSDDSSNTGELARRYRSVGYRDGVDFLYVLANGHQHNESYWAQRLPRALAFLVGPRPHTGSMP